MDAPAEPAAKRQRKEPSWRQGFVDPDHIQMYRAAAAAAAAAATTAGTDDDGLLRSHHPSPSPSAAGGPARGASAGPGGADYAPDVPRVLCLRPLDPQRVEVRVRHNGRRYKGVLERTGMPQGVGVATMVTREELSAIAVAPPHGENATNMCALCNTALERDPVVGMSDDRAGQYAKVRITSNWTARVHLQCALWAPEVKEDAALPGYLHHLGPAVRRGRALRCAACNERGATVGCFQEGCPAVYHLTCALRVGCAFNESTWEVWCPRHLR